MTILWASSHYSDKFLGLNLTGLFLPARLSHYPGQKYGDELVGKYPGFSAYLQYTCVFTVCVCARGERGHKRRTGHKNLEK